MYAAMMTISTNADMTMMMIATLSRRIDPIMSVLHVALDSALETAIREKEKGKKGYNAEQGRCGWKPK